MENRCVVLEARPVGVPGPEFFATLTRPVVQPGAGQFLVRNLFLSVDPAMRGWVNDTPNYLPPVAIGAVMRSFAVGEIVASNHPDYGVGELVSGLFGWQRFAISDSSDVMRRLPPDDPLPSLALGVLGLNGITAFFGLIEVCDPQPGETVVVSTAAGAVGSCVGQIAKAIGCTTVGIAGGPEKVRLCLDEFGYDRAIDYRAADLGEAIGAACPDGVNVYFDNTCGPISDAVLGHMARGARIAICGTAAIQEWDPLPIGPRLHRQLLVARARMAGFIVLDYQDRYSEAIERLTAWVQGGQITWREHVLDGLAAAPGSISMLYRGENRGKLLIRVD